MNRYITKRTKYIDIFVLNECVYYIYYTHIHYVWVVWVCVTHISKVTSTILNNRSLNAVVYLYTWHCKMPVNMTLLSHVNFYILMKMAGWLLINLLMLECDFVKFHFCPTQFNSISRSMAFLLAHTSKNFRFVRFYSLV